MPEPRYLTIPPEHAGKRLDQSLAELLPEYSRSRLQAWLDAGQVTVAAAPASRKQKVWGGEAVALTPEAQPEETSFRAEAIGLDIVKRPFVTAGALAFTMMVPLAATSTAGMMRRLGGRTWRRLHRLSYAAAAAAVIHYWWLVKADVRRPLAYGLIIGVLLAVRLVRAWRGSAL